DGAPATQHPTMRHLMSWSALAPLMSTPGRRGTGCSPRELPGLLASGVGGAGRGHRRRLCPPPLPQRAGDVLLPLRPVHPLPPLDACTPPKRCSTLVWSAVDFGETSNSPSLSWRHSSTSCTGTWIRG